MIEFVGKGVGGVIVIGKTTHYIAPQIQSEPVKVANIEGELARFQAAKELATKQLKKLYERACEEVGEANAQIFDIHRLLLEDSFFQNAVCEKIQTQKVNAEYALMVTARNFAQKFAAMEDTYMQARAVDVQDVSDRLLACLAGKQEIQNDRTEAAIICAEELTPSQVVNLEKDKTLAIVTARGSINSHTAILARSRGIPAIVGLGSEFLSQLQEGQEAIVDGLQGRLLLNPDEATKAVYRTMQQAAKKENLYLQGLRGKESRTVDGRKVKLCANVGSLEEIQAAKDNDAEGIGLFRSEALYLERAEYPTEEEQFVVYQKALENMSDKKVVIRTLDVGADKHANYMRLDKEENPALGLRGIRVCLTYPEIFKTQLRALYRASVYGKLGILFPMLTGVKELERVLALCEQVKEELDREGKPYAKDVELGIMIETPAAALISDKLAPMVDFFSVGTNDLTQYTLACDRQNGKLEAFCDTHHEALLRLIEMSVKNVHASGKWIGICGELAADTTLTEEFLRMGIDELSVATDSVLKLREAVRRIDLREWKS